MPLDTIIPLFAACVKWIEIFTLDLQWFPLVLASGSMTIWRSARESVFPASDLTKALLRFPLTFRADERWLSGQLDNFRLEGIVVSGYGDVFWYAKSKLRQCLNCLDCNLVVVADNAVKLYSWRCHCTQSCKWFNSTIFCVKPNDPVGIVENSVLLKRFCIPPMLSIPCLSSRP